MQLMIVEHAEKGQGLVVDRISALVGTGMEADLVVKLGVTYFEYPQPCVQYENPDDLTHIDLIDSVAELEDVEDGEGEEEEEEEGE